MKWYLRQRLAGKFYAQRVIYRLLVAYGWTRWRAFFLALWVGVSGEVRLLPPWKRKNASKT
jgi:hypothetical protein